MTTMRDAIVDQSRHEHDQFLRLGAEDWDTLGMNAREWICRQAAEHEGWLCELPEPQRSQLTAMLRSASR